MKNKNYCFTKFLKTFSVFFLLSCLCVTPNEFLQNMTVFSLSCILGYYLVWNVNHALHTPLMSVTNAVSGIIVVGAMLQINYGNYLTILSFIAVLITSINIFGGFIVT